MKRAVYMVCLCILFADVSDANEPGGEPGDKGLPGAKGPTGATGPAGNDGLIGFPGDAGPPGDIGSPGADGAEGAEGQVGPPGLPGPPGNDASNGTPGLNGMDGNVGERGIKGEQGPLGPPGTDGTDGPTGLDGEQGLKGMKGAKGDKGEIGEPGKDGINGVDGQPGPTGPPGDVGVAGDPGLQGDNGAQGPQGATGPVGETGDPGVEPVVADECTDTSLCNDPSGAAVCVNLKYGYVCSCIHGDQYGFSWDDESSSCTRPNDGKTNACDFNKAGCAYSCAPGATFVDYTCGCAEGFELSNNEHTCKDKDECAGDHGCVVDCINTYGGYECTCPPGYMLEGQSTCTNIDECAIDNGGCKQVCTDADPGYECSCTDGFVLGSDHESCLNENSVAVRMKLEKEFTAGLNDSESDESKKLCSDITSKISECQVDNVCQCTFSKGSIIVVVELQSMSASMMSQDDQEQLSWAVSYALISNGTTITLDGETITVDGPIVAIFDGSQFNTTLVLKDPCQRYDEENFCLEDSHCEVKEGKPMCICGPSFSGEQCNLPGPAYSTENEFSELEIVQLSLLILALLLALLSLFLGSYAYNVYHQRTSRRRHNNWPLAYSDNELVPPYGKYMNQRSPYGPRPFEVSLPDNRDPNAYRRFNRNY